MKILFACERSGGHLFPALILGQEMKRNFSPKKKRDRAVFFVTSPFLKHILEKKGFAVCGHCFPFRNLFWEGIYRMFEAPVYILLIRPKKVIGFGGRDSFFLLLWAKVFLIDTAIYEPNLSLGRANKILSLLVRRTHCGFKETARQIRKAEFAGIPLSDGFRRTDSKKAKREFGLKEEVVVLSVLGGSQGSRFMNEIFLKFVLSSENKFQIIHLTGKKEYKDFLKFYSKMNIKVVVKDFCSRMAAFYSATDILISRAGAMTVGEIVYFQIPAVLIPHPRCSSHQHANADYLKKRGGAIVFSQNDFSFSHFKETIEELIINCTLREGLKKNLRKIKLTTSSDEFYKKFFS